MTHRLLSQLNRRLARSKDTVTLRRYFGTGPNRVSEDCAMPAKVKGMMAEQLIGAITQQNYVVIVSPTDIIVDGWPNRDEPAVTESTRIAPGTSTARMPNTNDKLVVRFKETAISRVVPVWLNGECIRIELSCIG